MLPERTERSNISFRMKATTMVVVSAGRFPVNHRQSIARVFNGLGPSSPTSIRTVTTLLNSVIDDRTPRIYGGWCCKGGIETTVASL